jgi:amino acid transporter
MVTSFHTGNFHAAGGFNPFGFHGIFSAISTGGVIFAYLGFEQAIQLGGESSNPQRNIPVAVLGAMVVGIAMYVLLQIAFIAALEPGDLKHGWAKLGSTALAGPFAGLATAVGLGWLAILLYVDAAISPGGTGLLYTGTSARLSYALGRNGYIPSIFSWLSDRGVPMFSIAFSFLVGMVIFLPFPGWQKLVGFITAATVLAYALAPLALGALRRQDPERERPFRLPAAEILAPIGFMVANLIVYWAGWHTDERLFLAIGIGFVVFGLHQALAPDDERKPRLDLRAASWFWPYIGGMAIISWLGQYDGRGTIPFWWDLVVVAAFSLGIYLFALAVRLDPDRTKHYIGDLTAEDRQEKEELAEPAGAH